MGQLRWALCWQLLLLLWRGYMVVSFVSGRHISQQINFDWDFLASDAASTQSLKGNEHVDHSLRVGQPSLVWLIRVRPQEL